MKPIKAPPCPACNGPLHEMPARNAMSRIVSNVYVCPDCGVREALQGDFWFIPMQVNADVLRFSQAAWRKSNPAQYGS